MLKSLARVGKDGETAVFASRQRARRWLVPLLLLAGAVPGSAFANVSLRNGNFFVGYTDVVYSGGLEPKIERIYNHKTPYNGIFGWGWGNEYEVYLTVSADGSVVVHEYGGGAENRFNPVSFKQEDLNRAVDEITRVAQASGAVGGGGNVDAYKQRLRTDVYFRNEEWEKFKVAGKLQARTLPVGTQLISNRFSYQWITRTENGYLRSNENGKIETFEEIKGRGRLVKVADKAGNFLQFSYMKDGKLEKMVDNLNRKMFFSYNSAGKVERIQGESGKEATYKYNELGELIFAKNVDGKAFSYKYTSDRRHNLAEITYGDKTTLQISYHPLDRNENVKSVKDRDGTLTTYAYEGDKADRSKSTVTVAVTSAQGKPVSSSSYEYFVKNKADGEEWTYKMVTTLDGDRTETTYNECCGLPILIKRGSEETSFQYDRKGHVIKKTTPTEVTELAYDEKAGKVSKVTRFSKLTNKVVNWSEFKYDGKGNLQFARNSENKKVNLIYDQSGRIAVMVDQNGRKINFKYNEDSKPVEISDPAVGTITVQYYNSGEIKKVESSAGRKIALQVTSAFQNLLDIVRPAGVSLSF
jgi:YD repeat-containing protein